MNMSRLIRIPICLGILCCLVMASCSDVEKLELSNATLEGTITYQGKAVPYALVIVAQKGARGVTAKADDGGRYKAEHVPLGQAQIGVNTDAGRGMMAGQRMAKQNEGGGGATAQFVDVPKKFFEPTTSGITTTIVDGPNTYNIEMK